MVSIIMPLYNRQDFLPETLDSIVRQTYTHWQLVVVDDGSTDSSVDIIQQFGKIHQGKVKLLHSSVAQSGAAACRNIGIKEADGDLIMFLDSDDKLADFCLEQRVKVMSEDDGIDWAVFLQYLWKPEGPLPYATFNKIIDNKFAAIDCFFQMDPAWQTMAPIWKRSALVKLGGFDVTLIYMEDPDLHLRALLDTSLTVSINYHLPPDCFYRVDNMDETKAKRFYELSIVSRFSFLKKLPEFFQNIDSKEQMGRYKKQVRNGYFAFLKGFVLSRINQYTLPLNQSITLLRSLKIISTYDIVKIKILQLVFGNNSWVITKLRIKGLLYRIIN
ncbi:glycosyltransferase family 2 protein [Ferruginibacter lapsinanis]|uniref:glycosyltransferase family 2 protein n=1 Tax=Ferruginibacter lapsinanis TaxID=563172 RepID=UPI001E5D2D4E|nr:glycosyltransferase family 2 protein [Ferruginibacter lapsinanis]UEG49461.1 glycosyltransferase family 2 protein [Ferruginibacter lapsinanis]